MVTVFTPLYNRADIVESLYNSLKRQTVKDFEWLVIDDGSTDNPKEKFDVWIKENNGFEIRFYRVENGGKHRAINKGVKLAKGELFFISDSDDYLPDNAIELVEKIDSGIEDKTGFAGFSGIIKSPSGELFGTTFEGDYVDATSLDREKYGVSGDKSEVMYTEVMKKYPFPEIENENFITEDIVWSRMAADGYKIRWTNEFIYVAEYLEGGLTMQGREKFKKNPIGYTMYAKQITKLRNMSEKEKYNYYYYCYLDLKDTLGLVKTAKLLEVSVLKLWLKAANMETRQLLHDLLKKNR